MATHAGVAVVVHTGDAGVLGTVCMSDQLIFFFNYTAPTEIYPLSLHDALPIYGAGIFADGGNNLIGNPTGTSGVFHGVNRSEEYTSELQSPCNLVCRLLLE